MKYSMFTAYFLYAKRDVLSRQILFFPFTKEIIGEEHPDQAHMVVSEKDRAAARIMAQFYADEESGKGTWLKTKLPASTVALWDFTIEMVRRLEEAQISESEFVDYLLAEYVNSSSHADSLSTTDKDDDSPDSRRPDGDLESMKLYPVDEDETRSSWRELERELEISSRYWSFLPWSSMTMEMPENLRPDSSWFSDPFLMAKKLKEMRKLKQEIAWHQGALLLHMRNLHLQQELMFLTIERYALERMGLSDGTVRSRIKMAKNFRRYPLIEEAFLNEEICQQKVSLLGRVFDEGSALWEEWVDYAKRSTAVQLSRTVEMFLRLAGLKRAHSFRISPMELHEMTSKGRERRIPGSVLKFSRPVRIQDELKYLCEKSDERIVSRSASYYLINLFVDFLQ